MAEGIALLLECFESSPSVNLSEAFGLSSVPDSYGPAEEWDSEKEGDMHKDASGCFTVVPLLFGHMPHQCWLCVGASELSHVWAISR